MNQLKELLVKEIPKAIEVMSSLQVVDLINHKRGLDGGQAVLAHSDFMKKVPQVLGLDNEGNFSSVYLAGNNERRKCYSFPKRESYLMLMSYDYELQAAVYDRMEELERQALPQIPQTYAAALLEAGRLALENEQQAKLLEIAAPKAAFVDKYVESEGLSTFRQVAKLLDIKEPALRKFLTDNKIMYQLNKIWTPYEQHLSAGRFAGRETINKEQGKKYTQFLFTAKGVNWIADKINT